MRTIASILIAAALAGALTTAAHAQSAPDCNYDCLIGFTHRYMDALVHEDPSRIPLAADVKFTENDVLMPIGEGIWGCLRPSEIRPSWSTTQPSRSSRRRRSAAAVSVCET